MAIKRVWHGWTTKESADKYQDILHKEVLPGIEAKKIPGYKKIEVLRIDLKDEVENAQRAHSPSRIQFVTN